MEYLRATDGAALSADAGPGVPSRWCWRAWRKRIWPDGWGLGIGLLTIVILLPVATVLFYLTREGAEWEHLKATVLPGYIRNTFILVAGVVVVSLALAVLPAWLVTTCEFPLRRTLSWALIFPLAVPTYVAGFVYYAKGPDAMIPLLIWIRTQWGADAFLMAEMVSRYSILILLLAGVLYPYVYLACRAAFSQQGRHLIEAARCLGDHPVRVFFRVAVPMARPAIVAGCALVMMEVINDYGAVHTFGVPTLTEGIFRTWFGSNDKVSALRLAGIVMLIVAGILVAEQAARGRAKYVEADTHHAPLLRRRLGRWQAGWAFVACALPVVIGFLYPVSTLLSWAWLNWNSSERASFHVTQELTRGLWLSALTALVATMLAAVFAYAMRLRETPLRRLEGRAVALGYATPGAVVAVGVMAVLGSWDRLTPAGAYLLSGTLWAIGFAYVVRFFAIPLQLTRAGMERLGRPVEEASRVLGKSPLTTFWRVDLPLLKAPLLAAAMLVFVDILKELPLTMVLRPANFETLATRAFSLADERRLYACSVPSLLIIVTGCTGLVMMNRWLSPTRSRE